MRAIGVRATATEIFYSVIEGSTEKPEVLHFQKLIFPKAFTIAQALIWLREQFINICAEYDVKAVFVRTAETIGKQNLKSVADRARVEGVIIEAAASTGAAVGTGPLKTISSLIGAKSAKTYLDNDEFRGIDNWESLNDKFREASIAGVAALSLMEE
ncbi:hypothetical protein [Brevibacillus massiliensis]|uniref:hypothetical protein n=1 Tax=Brevibacillus massiliensis TaxID=1118054 RepID=UPI00036E532D|nr:hypothetical protein [Brevibacillus massiliensis]